jgi:hypothetical protein
MLDRSLQYFALRLSVRITKPQRGRAGFAIISFTGVSHAHAGPIRTGFPYMLTVPVPGVVIRLTHHHSPLRQSKLLAGRTFTPLQLVASHRRGWGSRLKQTTGSPFALRLTSERLRSVIIVGTPALIQFVLGHLALTFIYQYRQKTGSNVNSFNNSSSYQSINL